MGAKRGDGHVDERGDDGPRGGQRLSGQMERETRGLRGPAVGGQQDRKQAHPIRLGRRPELQLGYEDFEHEAVLPTWRQGKGDVE